MVINIKDEVKKFTPIEISIKIKDIGEMKVMKDVLDFGIKQYHKFYRIPNGIPKATDKLDMLANSLHSTIVNNK